MWRLAGYNFNASKSVLCEVGEVCREKLDNLYIRMKVFCWCDHFIYLGTRFISDQYLKVDISQSVRKFCASANAIYSHAGFVSEFSRLSLFEEG